MNTREIKFRGKSKETKQWVIGNLLGSGDIKPKTYFILSEDAECFDEYEEVISEIYDNKGEFTFPHINTKIIGNLFDNLELLK